MDRVCNLEYFGDVFGQIPVLENIDYTRICDADHVANLSTKGKIQIANYIICHSSEMSLDEFNNLVDKYRINPFENGNNFLYSAICSENFEIANYLLKNGIDVTFDNNLAIRLCAGFRDPYNLLIIQLLIKYGADVNTNNDFPIRYAASRSNFTAVNILFNHGADIHANDDYCLKILFELDMSDYNYDLYNERYIILKSLIKNGANVNAGNDYALKKCIKYRYYQCLDLLLEAGANASSLECDDLINAINSEDVVNKLIKYGADFTKINNFHTPNEENKKIVTKLLDIGVDPTILSIVVFSKLNIIRR
ncbi:MAG: putative ankyrin repeat protein [Satyrvirus sp.]|uniref:Putative ankyrin repeat protein n=1 Tax=Satyrvirus sp. TaxID=2487771 RepID=A0A3G5ADB1_9VIRU|nr:MAG: putative ankyrin repeat protein [Satyrvirus sp.]